MPGASVVAKSENSDGRSTPVEHYTTLCKHYTDSAITFTALSTVNTTISTDNLSPFLLVVDWDSIPDSRARNQSLYRLRYPSHTLVRKRGKYLCDNEGFSVR